ncbi:12864_t:CDS:1, partial [Gigaspora rosea]
MDQAFYSVAYAHGPYYIIVCDIGLRGNTSFMGKRAEHGFHGEQIESVQ